jgi:uncharacterized cupredoxin-like copper-binding protein
MVAVRYVIVPAVLVAALGVALLRPGAGVGQQPAGTPCPSPMASPDASPAASPDVAFVASPVASPEASPVASPAASGCPIVVEASDAFTFTPNEIVIAADTDVQITLVNTGVLVHDFSVDEVGIYILAEGGLQTTATFNVPAGTYEFYCSVPGHRESGMVGTLIVE